jgi:hypothetical protein
MISADGYKYVDYVSDSLTHDSRFAYECVLDLVSKYDLLDFDEIKFYFDGGPHFKNNFFISNLLEINSKITVNFFAEYHGKSIVDGHFGNLGKWYERTEKVLKIALDDASEMVEKMNQSEDWKHDSYEYKPHNDDYYIMSSQK